MSGPGLCCLARGCTAAASPLLLRLRRHPPCVRNRSRLVSAQFGISSNDPSARWRYVSDAEACCTHPKRSCTRGGGSGWLITDQATKCTRGDPHFVVGPRSRAGTSTLDDALAKMSRTGLLQSGAVGDGGLLPPTPCHVLGGAGRWCSHHESLIGKFSARNCRRSSVLLICFGTCSGGHASCSYSLPLIASTSDQWRALGL